MFDQRRVIKHHSLLDVPVTDAPQEDLAAPVLRIPGQRVHFQPLEEEDDAPAFVPRGVLRGGRARLAARAVEIGMPDLAPDFPLPPVEDLPGSEPEAEPPPDLDALQAALEAHWQARMEQEVQQAREEAYAQGYADARSALEQGFQEQVETLAGDMHRLEDGWKNLMERSEPMLVDLAFQVAECVLDGPLPPGIKGVVSRALFEAVEHLALHPPVEIALHPVDFLRLQESGLVEQLEHLHSGLRWEPSPDLKPGDWSAQSPAAAIRRLEAELINTLRSRIGLLTAMEKRKEEKSGRDEKGG